MREMSFKNHTPIVSKSLLCQVETGTADTATIPKDCGRTWADLFLLILTLILLCFVQVLFGFNKCNGKLNQSIKTNKKQITTAINKKNKQTTEKKPSRLVYLICHYAVPYFAMYVFHL